MQSGMGLPAIGKALQYTQLPAKHRISPSRPPDPLPQQVVAVRLELRGRARRRADG